MKRFGTRCGVLALLLVGQAVSGQTPPFDLRPYQSSDYVLLIVAHSPRDDRLFDFNLDISLQWEPLQARRVAVAEVTGSSFNSPAVARQFGLPPDGFGVALIRPDGTVLYRNPGVPRVAELLALIDAPN